MRVETVKYKDECLMPYSPPSVVSSSVYFLRMRVDAFNATA